MQESVRGMDDIHLPQRILLFCQQYFHVLYFAGCSNIRVVCELYKINVPYNHNPQQL